MLRDFLTAMWNNQNELGMVYVMGDYIMLSHVVGMVVTVKVREYISIDFMLFAPIDNSSYQ